MLYHLLPQFADVHMVFNLFVYLTFRAAGALVTSLIVAFFLGLYLSLAGLVWLTGSIVWMMILAYTSGALATAFGF